MGKLQLRQAGNTSLSKMYLCSHDSVPNTISGLLKQGIQDFHRKYVLVPEDKAASNVVVVWRLHYINTLKQELSGTKAYKETSEEEMSVVNSHCNYLALKFSVCVKERQDRLPTMYLSFTKNV